MGFEANHGRKIPLTGFIFAPSQSDKFISAFIELRSLFVQHQRIFQQSRRRNGGRILAHNPPQTRMSKITCCAASGIPKGDEFIYSEIDGKFMALKQPSTLHYS